MANNSTLFNLKRYVEAIRIFKSGIQEFPNDIEMATNLANAYGANNKYNEAAQLFENIYLKDTLNTKALQLMKLCREEAAKLKHE